MNHQVLKNIYTLLFNLILYLFPCFSLYPATYTVNPGESIQKAINSSRDGDTIVVYPGTYTENLKIKGKNIILRSDYIENPGASALTIIDGGHKKAVFTFRGNERKTCTIAGFTIINGAGMRGGGIAGNKTKATISDNIILNNSALFGGGIYGVSGNIVKNVIMKNTAFSRGGGIAMSNGTITKNTITENVTTGSDGGGLFLCNGTVKNNIIYKNRAFRTGGGFSFCNGRIYNNTVTSNTAGWSGGGFYGCLRAKIKNNIIWRNEAKHHGSQLSFSAMPGFCCIGGLVAGRRGNITVEPQFVNQGEGDFRLKKGSPCIDTGCFIKYVKEDFLGNPRPLKNSSNRFDIGAFESTGWITPAPPTGLTVENTGNSATLAWNQDSVSAACGYNIYRKLESDIGYTKLNEEPVLTPVFLDTLPEAGGTFFYVVTAVNDYGNESEYSLPVSIKVEALKLFAGGTLFYSGNQTGIIHIILTTDPDDPGSAVMNTIEEPGPYSFNDVPAGLQYWIIAYMDVNDNQQYETWEPYGSCGENPVPLNSNTLNLNIQCYDPDTDQDNLPDYWEIRFSGNLDMTAHNDPDADDLDNLSEYLAGTDPQNPDTDTDGITDGNEVVMYGTNPLNSDTDGDGWSDRMEIYDTGTDPLLADTDGDSIIDRLDPFPFTPATGSRPVITIINPAAGETINTGTGISSDTIDVIFNPYEGYAADDDADHDGVLNRDDLFPYDANEATDADQDGIGSNQDPDDAEPAVQGVIQILSPLPGATLYDSQY